MSIPLESDYYFMMSFALTLVMHSVMEGKLR